MGSPAVSAAICNAVYMALCEIAERGERCPTTAALGILVGRSTDTAKVSVAALRQAGKITVEHHGTCNRRITVVETGKATDWSRPEWTRNELQSRPPRIRRRYTITERVADKVQSEPQQAWPGWMADERPFSTHEVTVRPGPVFRASGQRLVPASW